MNFTANQSIQSNDADSNINININPNSNSTDYPSSSASATASVSAEVSNCSTYSPPRALEIPMHNDFNADEGNSMQIRQHLITPRLTPIVVRSNNTESVSSRRPANSNHPSIRSQPQSSPSNLPRSSILAPPADPALIVNTSYWTVNKPQVAPHLNDIELEIDPEVNIDGELSNSNKFNPAATGTGQDNGNEVLENSTNAPAGSSVMQFSSAIGDDEVKAASGDVEFPALQRNRSDIENEIISIGMECDSEADQNRRRNRADQLIRKSKFASEQEQIDSSHSIIYELFHRRADKFRQTVQPLDQSNSNQIQQADTNNLRSRTLLQCLPALPRSLRNPIPLAELSSIAKKLRVEATNKIDSHALEADIENMDVLEAKKLFLKVFGKGLFSCGLPMHVVEFYVILAGQRLGIHVMLFSISTTMLMSFGSDTHCHLVRPDKPSLSLSKMVEICEVAESVVVGSQSYEDSLSAVQRIVGRPSNYPDWTFLPCMTILSFAGAFLFAGGWHDAVVASFCGLLLGLLDRFAATHRSFARGQDLLSGFLSAVIVAFCKAFISREINALASVFAAIFWALPGLRAVMAMIDLSTGNPVTGTAKLFSTIMTMLNLGIGIAVGLQFYRVFAGASIDIFGQTPVDVPDWFAIIAVLACVPPSMVLLDGKLSHWPQFIAISLVSYFASNYASRYLDSALGTWIAAFSVGIVSNAYGRCTPNPAVELFMFGILMNLPGSIGVKSILASDTLSSVDFFFKMIAVAISIVTGLFSSNIVVPPIRSM